MKNIDKSLDIKPDYGYARFNKALAYELYERFDEALKWYDKALDIENMNGVIMVKQAFMEEEGT